MATLQQLAHDIFSELVNQAQQQRGLASGLTGQPAQPLSQRDLQSLAANAAAQAQRDFNSAPVVKPAPAPKPISLGPQQPGSLTDRTQDILDRMVAAVERSRAVAAQAGGPAYKAVSAEEREAMASQAAARALAELEQQARASAHRLRDIGNAATGMLARAPGFLNAAAGTSPALSGTLQGSRDLLMGEIGAALTPTILGISARLQQAARSLQGNTDTQHSINGLAGPALAAGTGMRTASMLGFAATGPVGWGAAVAGLALQQSGAHGGMGFAAMQKPLEQIVTLVSRLLEVASPALVIVGRVLEGGLAIIGDALESANSFLRPIAATTSQIADRMPRANTNATGTGAGAAVGQGVASSGVFGGGSFLGSYLFQQAGAANAAPAPAISTGFQSRQFDSADALARSIQMEATRDTIEQARFEQQMRVLQGIFNIMQAWNGGGGPAGALSAALGGVSFPTLPSWFPLPSF